jgi:hypothetical protein
MTRYLARRLVLSIITLWLLVTIVPSSSSISTSCDAS